MSSDPPAAEHSAVTQLLHRWTQGDRNALAQVTEALYPHLMKIAANRLRGGAEGATISPTELLHECWIRLAQTENLHFEHRAAFYGAAATIMRNVLVDRARSRKALKRGANVTVSGDATQELPIEAPESSEFDLEGVDKALDALERVCERQARQVDLRFFAGFSAAETADVLGISLATAKRDWLAARMFIKDFLDHNNNAAATATTR